MVPEMPRQDLALTGRLTVASVTGMGVEPAGLHRADKESRADKVSGTDFDVARADKVSGTISMSDKVSEGNGTRFSVRPLVISVCAPACAVP
jgi:hypothetical protein